MQHTHEIPTLKSLDIWREVNPQSIPWTFKNTFNKIFHNRRLSYSNLIFRLNIDIRGFEFTKVEYFYLIKS